MACQEYKILGLFARYLQSILNNNIDFKACQYSRMNVTSRYAAEVGQSGQQRRFRKV